MAEDKQSQGQGIWKALPVVIVLLAAFPLIAGLFRNKPEALPAPTAVPVAEESPIVSDGAIPVRSSRGEAYFPEQKNWVYHFTYAYPQLDGDSLTVAKINDTYRDVLNEMTQLTLPMFANAPDMRFDGRNEVKHDFTVPCNDGKLLSILQFRSQTKGEEGVQYALEPLTFGVTGRYAGDALTLRGVALVMAGVDPEKDLDDLSAQEYPELAALIDGSSSRLADVLLPLLYQEFTAMQQAGTAPADWDQDDFEGEFYPARDFYANEQGEIVFFFPPMLLTEPSFDVPTFSFTPARLNAILLEAGPEEEME